MALAEAMQLKTTKSTVHVVLDRQFLLVERYDRVMDVSGEPHRLHQGTFAKR